MAFGGPCPTPTDAMVFLDIMDIGDKNLSQKAVKEIADQINLPLEETAKNIFNKTCSMILDHANQMVDNINSKPVYTIHEFLEGYQIKPEKILLLGGPAQYFADTIEKLSNIKTYAVPKSSVANAIGAALARTTCEVSILADTEQGIVSAPEEEFKEFISHNYTEDDSLETAYKLLLDKSMKSGSNSEDFEIEVIEFQQFNIVRQFAPKGKIFRAKVQLKPGLIKGFEQVIENMDLL